MDVLGECIDFASDCNVAEFLPDTSSWYGHELVCQGVKCKLLIRFWTVTRTGYGAEYEHIFFMFCPAFRDIIYYTEVFLTWPKLV